MNLSFIFHLVLSFSKVEGKFQTHQAQISLNIFSAKNCYQICRFIAEWKVHMLRLLTGCRARNGKAFQCLLIIYLLSLKSFNVTHFFLSLSSGITCRDYAWIYTILWGHSLFIWSIWKLLRSSVPFYVLRCYKNMSKINVSTHHTSYIMINSQAEFFHLKLKKAVGLDN